MKDVTKHDGEELFIIIQYYEPYPPIGDFCKTYFEKVLPPLGGILRTERISRQEAEEFIHRYGMVLVQNNRYGKVWELSEKRPFQHFFKGRCRFPHDNE